jgi:hypothetical protein
MCTSVPIIQIRITYSTFAAFAIAAIRKWPRKLCNCRSSASANERGAHRGESPHLHEIHQSMRFTSDRAPRFCAGVVIEVGIVVRAADIVGYMIGWSAGRALAYARRRGW